MRAALTIVLLLAAAARVDAQLRGTFTIGASVSAIRPASEELATRARIRPTIGRVPARGWGLAVALNWFDADVSGEPVDAQERLGTVSVRPLMLGVGYTHVVGRLGISPAIVGGPALNTLSIAESAGGAVEIVGSAFERRAGVISAAMRPGVTLTYALAPRLGLSAFGGYLFNRPAFTLRTPRGDVRTAWSTSGMVMSGGITVALF